MTETTEILIHSARIVAGERVAIVGLLIALIAMLSYREDRKSSKWLLIAIITNIVHLIGDSEAFAYDLGSNIPYSLAWLFYFISYIFGYLIMIPFSMYVKSYIEEKTKINKWVFRVPILMEIVATAMVVAAIFSGDVFGNVDGRVAIIGGAPAPSTILSIAVIIYVFFAAMTKVKQIGLKASMLLGLFGLVPAAVIIINYDYSIMCGGMAVLVVFVLLQGDTSAEKEKQKQELSVLNARLRDANEDKNAQIEEITALNSQLEENQAQLEEAAAEQEAQMEEISALNVQLQDNQVRLEESKEQLEIAIEDAKNANKAKSEFLSRMSHDIRTPMNVIVGMTEIAKRHFDDSERLADCLEKINMESVHLQTLINDVLDISAIESGKLTIRKEEVRVRDIIENMNVSMTSLVKAKSIDYVFEQGNLFFPYLNTDNLRISQLYLNLLSNAVKYTPAGGRVKFEIWQELMDSPGMVALHARISDTGMGMSEEFMKNMYSEFSRAIDTRVNKIQGTGLGLAIVKQISELMGGTIHAQSELNRGTTFHVILPIEIIEKTDAKKKLVNEDFDYDELKGLRVLIAEDNDLNYEIANELLSDYGMVISRAEDGAVALDAIDSSEPGYYDLILMDMQMPVMDGLEATREIRKLNREDAKKIPIIAMTANAFAEDALACREAGMDSHVAKPIKVKFLMETILRLRNEKE